jgi:hypothetical protein
VKLSTSSKMYEFTPVELKISEAERKDVFAGKTNKTVRETLAHLRYKGLRNQTAERYPDDLDLPLGEFLCRLKVDGDPCYLRYLNPHGDRTFSTFSIKDKAVLNLRGLYAYSVHESLKYIGRCRDSYKQRINLGYGRISPKNCYIDGQSTNCHLNHLIHNHADQVRFWVCPLEDTSEIERAEKELIGSYKPEWNIQLT